MGLSRFYLVDRCEKNEKIISKFMCLVYNIKYFFDKKIKWEIDIDTTGKEKILVIE